MKRLATLLALVLGLSGVLAPAAQATTYDVPTLVLLVNFSNDTSQPYTVATARGVAFDNPDSIHQYWLDSSGGQVNVHGEVHGWYTIADTNEDCDLSAWQTKAKAAATADGVNVASFGHVIYGFSQGNCGWLGSAGGNLTSGIVYINAGISKGTWIHEFAHAIGLGFHTGHTDYPGAPRFEGTTYSMFFGPIWTASGGERDWLGIASTILATTSGTYVLPKLETNTVLRIPRPDGSRLVVDYRQLGGTVWSDSPLPGVSIYHLGPNVDNPPVASVRAGCYGDVFLAGETWYDAQARILVHVDSLSPTAATVTVTLDADNPTPGPDVTAPTAPTGLTGVKQGKNVALSWNASTDDRTCYPLYRVFRNGVQVGALTGTAFVDTAAPRRSTVSYYVKAVDSAGNVSGQSNTVTVKT